MKSADQVLARLKIYPHFAADRAIDLPEQSGWHLNKWDAAQVTGRYKSGQVAYHTSTERDDKGFSLQSVRGKFVIAVFNRPEAFSAFARRYCEDHGIEPGFSECSLGGIAKSRLHVCIRNDRATAAEFQARAFAA